MLVGNFSKYFINDSKCCFAKPDVAFEQARHRAPALHVRKNCVYSVQLRRGSGKGERINKRADIFLWHINNETFFVLLLRALLLALQLYQKNFFKRKALACRLGV